MAREIVSTNRTYYVSNTGSDSNDGLSPSTPFLTIQNAVNVVCFTLDIQNATVTIQVADGTYTEEINLYNWQTSAQIDQTIFETANVILQGNTTSPQNVVLQGISNPVNFSIIQATSISSAWRITGFTFSPIAGSDGLVIMYSNNILPGVLNFGSSIGGATTCIWNISSNISTHHDAQITISGSGWAFFHQSVDGLTDFSRTHITFTVSTTFNIFLILGRGALLTMNNLSINLNGQTVTGQRFELLQGARVYNTSQNLNFFPGSTPGTIDPTADYDGIKLTAATPISGLPTTTNLAAGFGGLFKDTSGGGVVLAYNDAGTIKTVTLT